MTNSQRRLILIAAIAFAIVQLVSGFRNFMQDTEGANLLMIFPLPLASLGIGLVVWAGRDKKGSPPGRDGKRPGRVMKGPWH